MSDNKDKTYNVEYTELFEDVVNFFSYIKKLSGIFPTLYTEPYFKWKITLNPFGKGASYLRYKGNVPVAHTSIVPKPLNPVLAVAASCGELGDSHTHPDFQKQGHFGAIGLHTIKEFEGSGHGAPKLLYGLPNENALPGWISRCNCEIYDGLNIFEFERCPWKISRILIKSWMNFIIGKEESKRTKLKLCSDDAATVAALNRLWFKSHDKAKLLIKKDGNWWKWRYKESSERYMTYALTGTGDDNFLSYIIVKKGWHRVRHLQICDIFAETPELVVETFRLFMKIKASSLCRVIIWAKADSPLGEELKLEGFRRKRKITVIFYRNEAYKELRKKSDLISLSAGDSDNI